MSKPIEHQESLTRFETLGPREQLCGIAAVIALTLLAVLLQSL